MATTRRCIATDIRAHTMPALSKPHEKLLCYAAWLDVRAKSSCGSAGDRVRAAEAAHWLKHWLQRLCSPSTMAFIQACAEEEVSTLAGGATKPADTP
jgi:hypothetical protein